MKAKKSPIPETSASDRISKRVEELDDWRGKTLARMRKLIKEADPDVVEEWKWVKPTNPGVPVFSHDGIICTGETYRNVVKLTFAKGAFVKDPKGLFNSSLEGNLRRAIDIREGERIDEAAFKALIREAVKLNTSDQKLSKKGATKKAPQKTKLLSGGNPQIAKADGDAPVQAYIDAIPDWKSEVARHVDAIVTKSVKGVKKAVKWNSPFYGVESKGWFLSFHCFTKYLKVTFFNGSSLTPVPPGESKNDNVRYLDIREDDKIDEKQLASWIKQAAELPGWDGSSKNI